MKQYKISVLAYPNVENGSIGDCIETRHTTTLWGKTSFEAVSFVIRSLHSSNMFVRKVLFVKILQSN